MTNPKITTLLFDYCGIFGPDSDDWSSYRGFAILSRLTNPELDALWDTYWPTISIGQQKLLDFMEAVATKSPTPAPPAQLLDTYLHDMTQNQAVINWAQELRHQGKKLIVLSNETHEAMAYKVARFNLAAVFHGWYASADIGMTKRNPQAFLYVLKEQSLTPSEVLFVDDRAHNVTMAKSLGLQGVHFQNLEQARAEVANYL